MKIGRLLVVVSLFWCKISVKATETGTSTAWINELHYDDALFARDNDEFVEIAYLDTLTDWSLVLYEGRSGEVYDTVRLADGIELGSGIKIATVSYKGIKDGGAYTGDGLALVDDEGNVVQFLSYEGSFAATNGPAAGLTAADIGVEERPSSTVRGQSLQLAGSGCQYSDFDWQTPLGSTPGAANILQTFICNQVPTFGPTVSPVPTRSFWPSLSAEPTASPAPTASSQPTLGGLDNVQFFELVFDYTLFDYTIFDREPTAEELVFLTTATTDFFSERLVEEYGDSFSSLVLTIEESSYDAAVRRINVVFDPVLTFAAGESDTEDGILGVFENVQGLNGAYLDSLIGDVTLIWFDIESIAYVVQPSPPSSVQPSVSSKPTTSPTQTTSSPPTASVAPTASSQPTLGGPDNVQFFELVFEYILFDETTFNREPSTEELVFLTTATTDFFSERLVEEYGDSFSSIVLTIEESSYDAAVQRINVVFDPVLTFAAGESDTEDGILGVFANVQGLNGAYLDSLIRDSTLIWFDIESIAYVVQPSPSASPSSVQPSVSSKPTTSPTQTTSSPPTASVAPTASSQPTLGGPDNVQFFELVFEYILFDETTFNREPSTEELVFLTTATTDFFSERLVEEYGDSFSSIVLTIEESSYDAAVQRINVVFDPVLTFAAGESDTEDGILGVFANVQGLNGAYLDSLIGDVTLIWFDIESIAYVVQPSPSPSSVQPSVSSKPTTSPTQTTSSPPTASVAPTASSQPTLGGPDNVQFFELVFEYILFDETTFNREPTTEELVFLTTATTDFFSERLVEEYGDSFSSIVLTIEESSYDAAVQRINVVFDPVLTFAAGESDTEDGILGVFENVQGLNGAYLDSLIGDVTLIWFDIESIAYVVQPSPPSSVQPSVSSKPTTSPTQTTSSPPTASVAPTASSQPTLGGPDNVQFFELVFEYILFDETTFNREPSTEELVFLTTATTDFFSERLVEEYGDSFSSIVLTIEESSYDAAVQRINVVFDPVLTFAAGESDTEDGILGVFANVQGLNGAYLDSLIRDSTLIWFDIESIAYVVQPSPSASPSSVQPSVSSKPTTSPTQTTSSPPTASVAPTASSQPTLGGTDNVQFFELVFEYILFDETTFNREPSTEELVFLTTATTDFFSERLVEEYGDSFSSIVLTIEESSYDAAVQRINVVFDPVLTFAAGESDTEEGILGVFANVQGLNGAYLDSLIGDVTLIWFDIESIAYVVQPSPSPSSVQPSVSSKPTTSPTQTTSSPPTASVAPTASSQPTLGGPDNVQFFELVFEYILFDETTFNREPTTEELVFLTTATTDFFSERLVEEYGDSFSSIVLTIEESSYDAAVQRINVVFDPVLTFAAGESDTEDGILGVFENVQGLNGAYLDSLIRDSTLIWFDIESIAYVVQPSPSASPSSVQPSVSSKPTTSPTQTTSSPPTASVAPTASSQPTLGGPDNVQFFELVFEYILFDETTFNREPTTEELVFLTTATTDFFSERLVEEYGDSFSSIVLTIEESSYDAAVQRINVVFDPVLTFAAGESDTEDGILGVFENVQGLNGAYLDSLIRDSTLIWFDIESIAYVVQPSPSASPSSVQPSVSSKPTTSPTQTTSSPPTASVAPTASSQPTLGGPDNVQFFELVFEYILFDETTFNREPTTEELVFLTTATTDFFSERLVEEYGDSFSSLVLTIEESSYDAAVQRINVVFDPVLTFAAGESDTEEGILGVFENVQGLNGAYLDSLIGDSTLIWFDIESIAYVAQRSKAVEGRSANYPITTDDSEKSALTEGEKTSALPKIGFAAALAALLVATSVYVYRTRDVAADVDSFKVASGVADQAWEGEPPPIQLPTLLQLTCRSTVHERQPQVQIDRLYDCYDM